MLTGAEIRRILFLAQSGRWPGAEKVIETLAGEVRRLWGQGEELRLLQNVWQAQEAIREADEDIALAEYPLERGRARDRRVAAEAELKRATEALRAHYAARSRASGEACSG